MDKVRVKITELSTQISEAASQNKEKIQSIKEECLYRIKDAEELI